MADDLIDIELGFDRLEALMIAGRCEAEGLRVGLRLMDDNGQAPGLTALQPHRMTIHEHDSAAVQAIVAASRKLQ